MVKYLLSIKCNSVFTDPKTKKNILDDINGQSALYWILTNMPELVGFNFYFFIIFHYLIVFLRVKLH
jgi:hypothetical protein